MKTPTVLKELARNKEKATIAEIHGREPEPDNLDKIADMTVKGLGYDQMDTATLAGKLVGKGPEGAALLADQGKLMAKEQQKQQQLEDQQRELNTAVTYDRGGKQIV